MPKKNFTLSANLENGIAQGQQYIATPNVKKVAQEIVNGYQTGIHSFSIIGTYGTGKSSFLLHFENDLLGTNHSKKLLERPSLIYDGKYEILNIVGDFKSMTDILLSKLQPIMHSSEEDAIKLLHSYYDRLKKRQKFLLIAIDEFGKILEHAIKHDPERELYFFQKLTEFVNVPTRNILLLTTLHQNFTAYASRLTQTQRNEWTKVKGRFKEIVFAEPIEHLLYLAAEHIPTVFTPSCPNPSFHKIHRMAVERKFVTTDLSLDTAEKLYPMDTFAAFAIAIATQRYGQNERSLFSFLNTRGPHSLHAYKPNNNKTYSLADAHDYVINNFYSYLNDANSDSSGWRAIKIAIERVECHDWSSPTMMVDAIKIIKAIGMLNIFGNAGFSMEPADLNTYAEIALGIKFPSPILKELQRLKIVRHAEYKKRLILFDGTDINIEEEIVNAALVVTRPVNYVDDLRTYFDNRISPVKSHYYHKGTPRFFEYQLVSTPQDAIPTGGIDGYVQLVFGTTETEYANLVTFSKRCQHAIIFVYFNNTHEIIDHFHNIKKYQYILEKVIVDKSDRVAIKEITSLIEYEKTLLNKILSESLYSPTNNVTWLYKGIKHNVGSHKDFNKLLSTVCDDVYYLTPTIHNELCNRHKLSSNIAGARAKYLQALLDNSDRPDLGFEEAKFPPEKTIYYTLLKNTGIHKNGEFTEKPTDAGISTLWDACEAFLKSTLERPRKLSELVKILTSQPYKIKEGLLEFWLPTYLFIKRQDYSLYGTNGQYIPNFNAELFDLMKKHLGEFKIKAYAVDGIKIRLFNQYRKFLKLGDHTTIKGSTFIETIKPFLSFYNKQLNDYARHTKQISHIETIKFRDVLANARDPEKAFLIDLPYALGYDDEKLHDEQAIQDYCHIIQRAVRELRGCYNQLIDRIEANMIEKLGLCSGEYCEYVKEVQKRLSEVRPHLLTPRQKEFHLHAMTHFDSRNEWFQSICYSVLGSPLEKMRDDQEAMLHDELIFLFKECEQKVILSKSLEYNIDRTEKERAQKLEDNILRTLSGNKNLDIYTLTRILQKKLDHE